MRKTRFMLLTPKADTFDNWMDTDPIIPNNRLIAVLMKNGECKWKLGNGKNTFAELKFITRLSEIPQLNPFKK